MKSKKNIVKILHVRCMQDRENKKEYALHILFCFQNLGVGRSGLLFTGRYIKFRIESVEIFRVEIILDNA